MPDAEVPNGCRRKETEKGLIINLDTGLPFSMKDDEGCSTWDMTLALTLGPSKR
jgi:hypothetical protein